MKKLNCDLCKHYEDPTTYCLGCVWNPKTKRVDSFKLKHDPLQNLFYGCPLMLNGKINEFLIHYEKREGEYYRDIYTSCRGSNARLPTIAESPRNTWLAHSGEDEMPEGLEGNIHIVWFKNSSTPSMCTYFYVDAKIRWCDVARFMIIDKEWKDND